jgi:hypothetical protein
MRIVHALVLATLAGTNMAHAWTYTFTNQTSGKLVIKVDLMLAKDKDIILQPGQQLSVKTSYKAARAIEIRGLSEPVALMKTIHKIKWPFWNYEFNISHRNYNYVDPKNLTIITQNYSPDVIIYPGSGELVVERR